MDETRIVGWWPRGYPLPAEPGTVDPATLEPVVITGTVYHLGRYLYDQPEAGIHAGETHGCRVHWTGPHFRADEWVNGLPVGTRVRVTYEVVPD